MTDAPVDEPTDVEIVADILDMPTGHHLVTYDGYQLTVYPDGMIHLPRLVRPQDIDRFIGCLQAARPVAEAQNVTPLATASTERKALRTQRVAQRADGIQTLADDPVEVGMGSGIRRS